MHRLACILLTIWAGSLWTVCALVAPTLFAVLEDRQLAGALAARFFAAIAWLGFAIGAALIAMTRTRIWSGHRRLSRWIVVTAVTPVASELFLGPMMENARAMEDMRRFAALHGLAGALFLIACVGALVLVWKVSRAE